MAFLLLFLSVLRLTVSTGEEVGDEEYEALYDEELPLKDRIDVVQGEFGPEENDVKFHTMLSQPDYFKPPGNKEIYEWKYENYKEWLETISFNKLPDHIEMKLPKNQQGQQVTMNVRISLWDGKMFERHVILSIGNQEHIFPLKIDYNEIPHCKKVRGFWITPYICVRGKDFKYKSLLANRSLQFCFEVYFPWLEFGGQFCYRHYISRTELGIFSKSDPKCAYLTLYDGGSATDPYNILMKKENNKWTYVDYLRLNDWI